MTTETNLWLLYFGQNWIMRRMNSMTRGTGQIRKFVLAAMPVHVQAGVMTIHTDLVLIFYIRYRVPLCRLTIYNVR
jgi:hypothetical protein